MTSAVWFATMSKNTLMPRRWASEMSCRISCVVPKCGSSRVKSVVQ
jgi:hypothetical protein